MIFFSRCLMLVTACLVGCSFTMESRFGDKASLNNTTFLSSWMPSGEVELKDGEYRGAAAPGSSSEIVVRLTDTMVFGKANSRDVAAVILVTMSGGSGAFYDLALLLKTSQGWNNVDVAFLGDRVKIHSIDMKDNQIVIDMTTHNPTDAMCCPSHRTHRAYTIEDDQLHEVGPRDDDISSQSVVGTVWKWQQTLENNDTRAVPENPNDYTFTLLPEGQVSVRADCNQAGGVYTLNGTRLSIEITHTTMAACPPGSLEQRFIRYLNGAAGYFMKGHVLYIDLKYDTGTMKFSK